MAFNVDEDIKTKPSLLSIGNVPLKNVSSFNYLGHMVINTNQDPSQYLNHRISSAFQKWNDLKHVLTDKKITMSTRTKILEACVRNRLLYSVQAWELLAKELIKIESIWHSFLRKMIKIDLSVKMFHQQTLNTPLNRKILTGLTCIQTSN